MAYGKSDGKEFSKEIIHDFGPIGQPASNGWIKHLTLTSWNGNSAKFDLRSWSPDFEKCGKGLTLDDAEAFDLVNVIENAFDVLNADKAAKERMQ